MRDRVQPFAPYIPLASKAAMPIGKNTNVENRVGIMFSSLEPTVGSHFAASSVPSGRVDMNIIYIYNLQS